MVALTVATVMAVAVFAVPGPASGTTCQPSTTQPPTRPGGDTIANGVAVVSTCLAWLVGAAPGDPLIERWNGSAWKFQPVPNPDSASLNGVAATSASNAWAVGSFFGGNPPAETGLIEHWNGTLWKVQPSPRPDDGDILHGVAATSASNAWAVGEREAHNKAHTLVEHWNGRAWTVQSSPDPDTGTRTLLSISAISASNAWAVGYRTTAHNVKRTLILHWNGSKWSEQTSPNPGIGDNALRGVAATSATNAWAVGIQFTHVRDTQLILHWNGTSWRVQANPNPQADIELNGVAATSASNAWAVGTHQTSAGQDRTLIEHWNGATWKVQGSPNPGSSVNGLNAVAASSTHDAWAVGQYYLGGRYRKPLAIHRS
jgi:hypothetical protein